MRGLGLIAAALAIGWGGRLESSEPVTNCLEVVRMAPGKAREHRPVRLKGVLTCYIPASQLCFVQDASGGAYIFPTGWPPELAPGDLVEVDGRTDSGRFSSIVSAARLRKTGRGSMPPALPVALEDLNTGRFDCQWIELRGVLQEARGSDGGKTLSLNVGGSSAIIVFFGEARFNGGLVDAEVRLRGVGGTLYAGDRLSGFGLFVHRAQDTQVLRPAVDAFTRPPRPIGELVWFTPDREVNHRIRVRGTLTSRASPRDLFLQDDSGAIHASLLEPLEGIEPGDLLEVSGFLRDPTGSEYLVGALARKVGRQELAPRRITGEQLAEIRRPALVSLECTVLGIVTGQGKSTLALESGGRLFHAFTTGTAPKDLIGARVRLAGVWNGAPGRGTDLPAGLIPRPGEAPVILERADPASVSQGLLAPASRVLLGSMAGIVLLSGVLAWRAAAAERAQARQALAASQRLRETEEELHQVNQARERLGRDLHDHIIQSIYAVGLNLDDCVRQVRENPERVQNRLSSALEDVNGVIRELRNVILGLETHAIKPAEFRTALKSLALALGNENSNRIRLDINQAAMESLSPSQATELIHIAREALSNSLRHGQAATTTFTLQNGDRQTRFTIEDDGRGFDPAGQKNQGFGLRNMAKRAENLGATFSLASSPGRGTRIVLDIPRQKQHFSSSESSSRSDR